MKPIVLFVTPLPPFFLSHRLPVVREAKSRGFETHIVVPATELSEALRRAGLTVHEIPFARSTTNPLRLVQSAIALSRVVRRVRPRVVHPIAVQAAFVVAQASSLARFPQTVVSFTGLGHLWTDSRSRTRPIVRSAVATAIATASMLAPTDWVFQNEDDEAAFSTSIPFGHKASVHRIAGSGVDLSAFDRAAGTAARDTIVFLGRTLEDKGIRDFVNTARRLRPLRSERGLRVVVAGAPDTTNPTSLSASELDDFVTDGSIDRWGFEKDVSSLLARALLVVFPSYREGFPKAVMEASAAGVPVVGYDVPGVRQAVVRGETGELVPFRDEVKLTEAVRALLTDRDLYSRFSSNAALHAAKHFDERAIAARVVDLYSEGKVRSS
jgi:glycosyltransferase involved in cell wall biosynthesis